MKFEALQAGPDLMGPRIRVRWTFRLEGNENLNALPRAGLRRKERDFEFPEPPAGQADPHLIYDSGAFPLPGDAAVLYRESETSSATGRLLTRIERVIRAQAEVQRRTTWTEFGPQNQPLAQTVEILDADPRLQSHTTYYYELRVPNWSQIRDRAPYRGIATATRQYGLGRKLFDLLPELYRRHDVVRLAPAAGQVALPESDTRGGQLQRFLEVFGFALDHVRSRAECLPSLHDVRFTDARLLPWLARWIGWDLNPAASVPLQRHEIRYAPHLYHITGTLPACRLWMRRLTGWEGNVHEFGRNVFFSNDLGNPDDPTDKGSRTVDTADAALLAKIRQPGDKVDYTYDPGTGDDAWYAYNTVGLFLRPPANANAAAIAENCTRLARFRRLFLPANIRGVVIPEVPVRRETVTDSISLLRTED